MSPLCLAYAFCWNKLHIHTKAVFKVIYVEKYIRKWNQYWTFFRFTCLSCRDAIYKNFDISYFCSDSIIQIITVMRASWCLKLPATQVFVRQFVQANTKRISKIRVIGLLWRESMWRWSVDSLHKGPVMWKTFTFHDVMLTSREISCEELCQTLEPSHSPKWCLQCLRCDTAQL